LGFSSNAPLDGPLSPDRALASFDTEPGLRVELVAAEPLIDSPSALAFDERGRLFVAENRGYPTGGPNGAAVGRVALLEDTDGDGRTDKRTDFATDLTYPNSVMPWRGGLIVTCAPEVFYFKDTDGDSKADVKEVLLTGFATNQSTQLRVNAPTLGPDGWVYLASGLSGGKITSPKRPESPAHELKGDLRFKPDTGEFEGIDGKAQFGQSFDDFGRRFGVFNRVQVQHFVLPSRYVARNPHLSSPGVMQDCPELVVNKLMRHEGGAARIFPISANFTTADSHAGYFTAACAIHVYRGDALPAEYFGCAFSCDPTGNLVHYDRLEPAGATFAARRVRDGVEFLRSPDSWFRPVFLATGPAGALYVCDMYRKSIEHPEYLPEEVRKRTDFASGKGMGRVWKVQSSKLKAQTPKFAADSTEALLRELNSPNGWRRDTAFRLLVERRPKEAAQALLDTLPKPTGQWEEVMRRPRTEFDSPGDARAAGRAQALSFVAMVAGWPEKPVTEVEAKAGGFPRSDLTLPLMHALVASTFDESPGVRETAFRFLGMAPGLSIADEIVSEWADDPNPRVRFQCALALGNWDISGALEALARIAVRDGADRWTRAAVLSGLNDRALHFLDRMMEDPSGAPQPSFMADLGRLVGATQAPRDLGQRHWLWPGGPGTDWKLSFWAAVAEAVRANEKIESVESLTERLGLDPARLNALSSLAIGAVRSQRRPVPVRDAALAFLRQFGREVDRGRILQLIDPLEPIELQAAAARALCQPGPLNSVKELLSPRFWEKLPPTLRSVVLNSLVSQPANHAALLDALEGGAVPSGALNTNQRDQLKKTKDESLRARAEKLFASATPGDRQKAYEDAKACLALKPAPANGREVFKRACAQCHRLDREGVAVGPDLFDIRHQPKESILLHLVIPEAEINPTFTSYVCETKDGRTLTGVLVADTPANITLRQGQGLEDTIARANIVRLEASVLSLMPQELEKSMTAQELADLLAFLKGEASGE